MTVQYNILLDNIVYKVTKLYCSMPDKSVSPIPDVVLKTLENSRKRLEQIRINVHHTSQVCQFPDRRIKLARNVWYATWSLPSRGLSKLCRIPYCIPLRRLFFKSYLLSKFKFKKVAAELDRAEA